MARDDSAMVPRQAAGGGAAAIAQPPPPRAIAHRLLRATVWLLGILAALMATAAALVLLARTDPEGWLADIARAAAARFEPFERQTIARAGAPAPLPVARFQAITLAHLMTMRTGIAFDEGYASPFSDVARWYLARDLGAELARLEIRGAPGRRFAYQSSNTQLVAMALERALGIPLAAYAQSRLWQPMGAEFDAAWGSDRATPPHPKAFCCFVATAIDLARFGQLHLDALNASPTASPGPGPLLPPHWVRRSTAVLDETRGTVNDIERRNIDRPFARQRAFFSHGWRRGAGPGGEPSADFHAQGLLGQHLLVAPLTQTVIVRLGTRQGGIYWPAWMSELARLNP